MLRSAVIATLLAGLGCSLAKKGITLNDLALVIENDEQTRLAIDSATAIRVYEAAGIPDVGKQVMVAKAGATSVSVVNNSATDPVQ